MAVNIRSHFESAPYGWSRDAVDGGLQVLLVAGLIRVEDDHGKPIDPRELERKTIGKVKFKVEAVTVTTMQRLKVRKLLQKIGLNAKQNEELSSVPQFLHKMLELAKDAGGEEPQPKMPDTQLLEDIRLLAGNEQLIALFNSRDELTQCIDTWTSLPSRLVSAYQTGSCYNALWVMLQRLQDADVIQAQVTTIEEQRQLLDDPDQVKPLVNSLRRCCVMS